MTLTAFTRRSETADGTGPNTPTSTPTGAAAPQGVAERAAGRGSTGSTPATPATGSAESTPATPPTRSIRSTRDADGLAVASFILGLVGLLVMNILLGPAAIVMAIVALARSTARRGRALLGLALGVADLVVLAFLVTGNGAVAWHFSG